MKKELFRDLNKILQVLTSIRTITFKRGQKDVDPAKLLANVLAEHSTAAELKVLTNDYPSLGFTKRAKATKPVKAEAKEKADNGAVTFTVVLGPYGTETQARQEAQQFTHPQVFWYRSAIFPNPGNYRVVPTVTESQPVRLAGGNASTLYPFGVQLTLSVTGAPEKVRSWIETFKARARPVVV